MKQTSNKNLRESYTSISCFPLQVQGVRDSIGGSIAGSIRGASKLTLAVFLTLFGIALYLAYNILPFYYYYFELIHQMEAVIRVANTDSDDEIRKKLVYHIRHMEIPVGSDEELSSALRIERLNGEMKISLPYEEIFFVTWQGKDYDLWKFKFRAHAEGRF